jgi:acyl-CoA thioester hydrolase
VRLALTPSTDPSDYRFVHHIRPRFAETDAMGVIHHGAYVPYLEEARAAMLKHAGHHYNQVREAGIDFAVLELFVSYRKPLYFDEEVEIYVDAAAVTRTTFQAGYLIQVAGETRSTAVTVHGAVDSRGRGVRLPSWLAEAMDTFPVAPFT